MPFELFHWGERFARDKGTADLQTEQEDLFPGLRRGKEIGRSLAKG